MSVVAVPGIPGPIMQVIQQDLLDRTFNDALYPQTLFRQLATPERWAVNLGETQIMTRNGLMQPDTRPLTPGQDPAVGSYGVEQWIVTAAQYGKSVDTNLAASNVALASTFLNNTNTLGLQAGSTMNRLTRNRLLRAYLGGNTNLAVAASSSATTIEVASINGFTEKIPANGLEARPLPVGPSNPLSVLIDGVLNTVIGAAPADFAKPFGRGTLSLGTPLAANAAIRAVVLANTRSRISRVGGASSIDGLSGANILTLADITNAVTRLRTSNVPPMMDGFYHVHLTPEGEAQLFLDTMFQRLYQGVPDNQPYRELMIAQLLGCRFFRNNEMPNDINSGELDASGSSALVSSDIGAEIVNGSGRLVRRAIVVGARALVEKYIDESAYITEAGVTGKVGAFSVVNNGLQVMTDRIRLIIRAPQDRLQQVVSQTWSWSGDFGIPSDSLTGDPAVFKRAVVIEHV